MKNKLVNLFLLILILGVWAITLIFIFSPLKADTIDYKGYTMLEYTKAGIPVAICHSPECHTCIEIFD